jgi:hypothetical protein
LTSSRRKAAEKHWNDIGIGTPSLMRISKGKGSKKDNQASIHTNTA